jgi:predicted HNH restriction endonuclease
MEGLMNYWIFSVTNHKTEEGLITALEIYDQRMRDGFWGIGENIPNKGNIKPGDRIVFYIGNPIMKFAGCAIIASELFKQTETEKEGRSHGRNFFRTEIGILLKDINHWKKLKPAKEIMQSLEFIKNKERWGAYIQGGLTRISEEDFKRILDFEQSNNEEEILNNQKEIAYISQELDKDLSEEELAKRKTLIENSINNMDPIKQTRLIRAYERHPKAARWIKEKANFTCEVCGESGFRKTTGGRYAEAHHQEPYCKFGKDDLDKMICVCAQCHAILHFGTEEEFINRQKFKIHR